MTRIVAASAAYQLMLSLKLEREFKKVTSWGNDIQKRTGNYHGMKNASSGRTVSLDLNY
jgi:hypothetical protein